MSTVLTYLWSLIGFVPIRTHNDIVARLLRCQQAYQLLRRDRDRLMRECMRLQEQRDAGLLWMRRIREKVEAE